MSKYGWFLPQDLFFERVLKALLLIIQHLISILTIVGSI